MQHETPVDLELDHLSGRILDLNELPRSKRYLLKYFRTREQRLFVKYLLSHGKLDQFVEHTGVRFRSRWLAYLARRVEFLEKAHQEAKDANDMEALAVVSVGETSHAGSHPKRESVVPTANHCTASLCFPH